MSFQNQIFIKPPYPPDGISIIRFPDLTRWHLVAEYFKLRKEVFVDRKDWSLFHAEEFEFEQYDSFDTTYIVATREGRVAAGRKASAYRSDQWLGRAAIFLHDPRRLSGAAAGAAGRSVL